MIRSEVFESFLIFQTLQRFLGRCPHSAIFRPPATASVWVWFSFTVCKNTAGWRLRVGVLEEQTFSPVRVYDAECHGAPGLHHGARSKSQFTASCIFCSTSGCRERTLWLKGAVLPCVRSRPRFLAAVLAQVFPWLWTGALIQVERNTLFPILFYPTPPHPPSG